MYEIVFREADNVLLLLPELPAQKYRVAAQLRVTSKEVQNSSTAHTEQSSMQETRERFVTQWRPTTSFGYQDFDLEKHLVKEEKKRRKAVKEAEKLFPVKKFFYFSKPLAIADYNSNKTRCVTINFGLQCSQLSFSNCNSVFAVFHCPTCLFLYTL